MKAILFSLLFISFLSVQAQNNPWINEKAGRNPWITEKERIKQAELEKQKAESIKIKSNSDINSNEKDATFINSSYQLDSMLSYYNEKGIDISVLATEDADKYFDDHGYGAAGFFVTLVPIIGNPIIWITSAIKPNVEDISNTDNPRNILLQDNEYKETYRKKVRKNKGSKMMTGNILSNITKIFILIKLING